MRGRAWGHGWRFRRRRACRKNRVPRGKSRCPEVEDEGIFREAKLVKFGKDAADVFVEAMDGFCEVVVETVEGRDGVFVEGSGFHVVNTVDAIAALLANGVGM